MCSWNAGAADASHLAKMVGLKHGINAQAWRDPWGAMREKLHVAEVNNDSSSSESSDDDDDYLRPFEAPKKPTCCSLDVRIVLMQIFRQRLDFKDKPKDMVTKSCAKSIPVVSLYLFHPVCDLDRVDELLAEVCTAETVVERKERRATDRINKFVTLPGTQVQISKRQLTELMVQDVLRCGRADGTSLSKDRVARIKATAARVKAESERMVQAAVDGERVHLQDDLAFCFIHRDGSKKMWFGKLQQMRTKRNQRTRNVHDSIDLCDPPPDLTMQIQWYHETRKGSARYVPSVLTTNVDRTFVHVNSCLGLCEFKYVRGAHVLSNNGQLERFKRLMKSIN